MAILGLHPSFATSTIERDLEKLGLLDKIEKKDPISYLEGLDSNFDRKTYDDYISDARVFSQVKPGSIVHWFLNKPRIYTRQEFKKTRQDRYLEACFKQKTDHDSEISLKWSESLLIKRIQIKKDDLELFKNVKRAFIQLSYQYDFLLRNQTKDEQYIFTTSYTNYNKASKIIAELIDSEQRSGRSESKKESPGPDAIDLLLRNLRTGLITEDEFHERLDELTQKEERGMHSAPAARMDFEQQYYDYDSDEEEVFSPEPGSKKDERPFYTREARKGLKRTEADEAKSLSALFQGRLDSSSRRPAQSSSLRRATPLGDLRRARPLVDDLPQSEPMPRAAFKD
ncbi:MAG: hypothetical protein K940chlam5_00285 [Candidatus Anoxychlamydiales bacterium]|nr:hypothetical protein [Candidatus Anoxychlamydiales bacterium]